MSARATGSTEERRRTDAAAGRPARRLPRLRRGVEGQQRRRRARPRGRDDRLRALAGRCAGAPGGGAPRRGRRGAERLDDGTYGVCAVCGRPIPQSGSRCVRRRRPAWGALLRGERAWLTPTSTHRSSRRPAGRRAASPHLASASRTARVRIGEQLLGALGRHRSSRPPWLLAATAMLPLTRNASPPNIFRSVTPGSPPVVADPGSQLLVVRHASIVGLSGDEHGRGERHVVHARDGVPAGDRRRRCGHAMVQRPRRPGRGARRSSGCARGRWRPATYGAVTPASTSAAAPAR